MVCVGGSQQQRQGGREWPAGGGCCCSSTRGLLALLVGVDGRPQISAALSHRHVTGRGQWHRQYLNQLHCSSAIGGALRRQGSYWRQRQALWGERGRRRGERVWEKGGKNLEGRSCCLTMEISADRQFVLNNK